MARHFVEIVGLFLFIIFIITMIYHWFMIKYQKQGYSQRHYRRDSENVRKMLVKVLNNKEEDL